MRAVLGVAIDDGEVCAVLVDADVAALGPFDTQRWVTGEATDLAEAAGHAVAAMRERAAQAGVPLTACGVVAGQAPPGLLHAGIAVHAVTLDEARLSFLAAAPELGDVRAVALIGRDGAATTASIADIRSGAVLASVTTVDDGVGAAAQSLPESVDEAVARAGVPPEALVFLDLRPGDAALAREVAAVLGVPFVTPHGVPWHRATGAALAAAAAARPPDPMPAPSGRNRVAALVSALVALAALLGGGLAVAIGEAGSSDAPTSRPFDAGRSGAVPPLSSEPVPAPPTTPCAGAATPVPADPSVRPARWPLRRSDPDPGTGPTTTVTAPPCE